MLTNDDYNDRYQECKPRPLKYRERLAMAKEYGNNDRVYITKQFPGHPVGRVLKPHKDVARRWIRSGFAETAIAKNPTPAPAVPQPAVAKKKAAKKTAAR